MPLVFQIALVGLVIIAVVVLLIIAGFVMVCGLPIVAKAIKGDERGHCSFDS